jgi:sortase A
MNKRSFIKTASTLLVIAGVAMGGYSITQIRQMNAYSGSTAISKQVLPELAPSALHSDAQINPQEIYNQVTISRGSYLGKITIPALKQTLPIYQGTEDSQLKMGIGHYEKSVLPGVKDNSVLSGHRDSVFSQLGRLKVGELLTVETVAGKFTYKISGFRIVGANDRTVIVPTKTAVLTLTTCYPFHYIGSAPKRFIVSADLVPQAPAV